MKEYKIFKGKEISKNLKLLMKFYGNYYNHPCLDYRLALKNSSHVCCCLENGVVIGACRLMTDYGAHTYVVDLIVKEEKRGRGIGRRLMKDAIRCIAELNTHFNALTTDPRRPWLKKFYESLGFTHTKHHYGMNYQLKTKRK